MKGQNRPRLCMHCEGKEKKEEEVWRGSGEGKEE
jgi:hypothetical protein